VRHNTKKGSIGKRRIYLNEREILSEFSDGLIYRYPIYGAKLVSGHWYVDVLYSLGGRVKNEHGLVTHFDRWTHPVYLHFAGYGSAKTADGDDVIVCLFNEMINDAGIDYKTKRWGRMFSFGGIDSETPLFQPCMYELEKVKRRASEKRHGWSK